MKAHAIIRSIALFVIVLGGNAITATALRQGVMIREGRTLRQTSGGDSQPAATEPAVTIPAITPDPTPSPTEPTDNTPEPTLASRALANPDPTSAATTTPVSTATPATPTPAATTSGSSGQVARGSADPSGAVPCNSAPSTPEQCFVQGNYVGGRQCGVTTGGQTVFFLQSPGIACASNSECPADQVCGTLAPGSPNYCYPLARCTSTTAPTGPGGNPMPPPPVAVPSPPGTPPPPTGVVPPPPAGSNPMPPPPITTVPPPPLSAQPPPPIKSLPADAQYCNVTSDTPAACYVSGSFIGGRDCGLTTESQTVYFLQSPGSACTTSNGCSGDQFCATLAPPSPTYCYPLARCTSTTP